MSKWLFIFGFLVIVVAEARDSLTVIYDSGDTLPIAPYLPEMRNESTHQTKLPKRQPFQLPVRTPSLKPGPVAKTQKPLTYLQQPLFLVGADAMSQAWLKANHSQLQKIQAVGLLVQADTIAEINTMLVIADGLQLVPVPAESIAKLLGLTHYPVLLSKQGWEQ